MRPVLLLPAITVAFPILLMLWQVVRWRLAVRRIVAALTALRAGGDAALANAIGVHVAGVLGVRSAEVITTARRSAILGGACIGVDVGIVGSTGVDRATVARLTDDVRRRSNPNLRFSVAVLGPFLQVPATREPRP